MNVESALIARDDLGAKHWQVRALRVAVPAFSHACMCQQREGPVARLGAHNAGYGGSGLYMVIFTFCIKGSASVPIWSVPPLTRM